MPLAIRRAICRFVKNKQLQAFCTTKVRGQAPQKPAGRKALSAWGPGRKLQIIFVLPKKMPHRGVNEIIRYWII